MRLNVYGFLQFFRDFSNCFFSSLFVKNMPKHATRVKGVPGAFVREIRPINCDPPRLAQGPRHAVLGPGARDRGTRPRDQGPGTRDQGSCQACQGSRPPDQAPGIAQACQGSCQACQGARSWDLGPGPRDLGPGPAVRGTFAGVLGPPRAARIGGGFPGSVCPVKKNPAQRPGFSRQNGG